MKRKVSENNSWAEQEKFYSDIAEVYSGLFPFNPAQLQFIEVKTEDLSGRRILDLGCGTGELAYQLAERNATVDAIDLNRDFIKMAVAANNHPGIFYREMDMLDIEKPFPPGFFDTVICFGNTLVHLSTVAQASDLIRSVFGILKEGGWFLIQILNYDYILSEKVSELPLIENSRTKFIRRYVYPENSNHIRFNTELIFKDTGRSVSNETSLLPLTSSELSNLLRRNRFTDIELFAGFNRDPFGGRHLPLVVSCRK